MRTGSTSLSRRTRPTSATCSTQPLTPRSQAKPEDRMKVNELKPAPAPEKRRPLSDLEQHRGFVDRHIGTNEADQVEMLKTLGYPSRAELIDAIVPASI